MSSNPQWKMFQPPDSHSSPLQDILDIQHPNMQAKQAYRNGTFSSDYPSSPRDNYNKSGGGGSSNRFTLANYNIDGCPMGDSVGVYSSSSNSSQQYDSVNHPLGTFSSDYPRSPRDNYNKSGGGGSSNRFTLANYNVDGCPMGDSVGVYSSSSNSSQQYDSVNHPLGTFSSDYPSSPRDNYNKSGGGGSSNCFTLANYNIDGCPMGDSVGVYSSSSNSSQQYDSVNHPPIRETGIIEKLLVDKECFYSA